MMSRLTWTIWTSLSTVPRKVVNQSLTHSYQVINSHGIDFCLPWGRIWTFSMISVFLNYISKLIMAGITPGTLMTSAAADVINHNGRKIGHFKPIRFCYARMTSAQSWSRRHHWFEPTSSLPIFNGLYLVICKTLALIFPVQLKEC